MSFFSTTFSTTSSAHLGRGLISIASAAAFATLLSVSVNAQQQQAEPLPLPLDEVRMFTEAMDRIRMAYVEEIDDKTLLENAIRGMLAGLDPHSAYMAGNDYDNLQETTTGEFGGLGIEVGREDGYIRVISPIDDTPADRAGIQAGDLIIQIDNKPLREMLPQEAAQMMRGEPGTEITITIAREGQEPFDLTIVREVIAVASVRSRILEPGYIYIRIPQFRVNTGNETEAEIEKLYEEHGTLKGIILDLRNNPGGVLQASVGVVDSFISQGRIVYTEGRLEGNNQEYNATRKNVAGDVPVVVLINNGSASASEIVAGALQDHGRAIIMGTRSFGKGSVQTIMPLSEERAIKLTTSLYFTPSGRSIQAQGIEPDIIVDEAFVTRRSRNVAQYNESDLQGHLENGNGTEEVDSNAAMADALISAEEVLVNDYPLNEALNVLKGINAFNPPVEATETGSFAQRIN
ncbi:MAG TPA: S41 family peptidase [Porticoccaceae bacterium]|jgi:carboxyl-terminal processing protease|nr:S41 family peptidase [Gammaproteobacteria bacterium]HIL61397.1 S41 family peptidase [Porticoccaceae bacterium]